ncbi:hypothetical protein RvY_02015 [Ramazzottius varieornatus]|uniref:Secreted protein n=1 Tax=Ramazzottius varieornatus TaxID=947166 RepID=A0A1D1UIC8_RAMVA|nr:hypothetical protein RvY_02015 [Ramazzottius varieornatus]
MDRPFWQFWTLLLLVLKIIEGLTCDTCNEPGEPKGPPCASSVCEGGNDGSVYIRADCVHHSCFDPYYGVGDHNPASTSLKGKKASS